MSELLTPEGTLALAIVVLELVLGWRFTLPERGRDVTGFCAFAVAVVVGFLAGRGLLPISPPLPSALPVRLVGSVLLLAGLFLAGASSRARLDAGRGQLATGGPYAWVRHPLYLGLALVLTGGVLRTPSVLGGVLAACAVALQVWLGRAEERAARDAFGPAWRDYAARTHAVLPRRARS